MHIFLQGLENSWKRHKEVAEYFHKGLEEMGLKLFVQDKVGRRKGASKITKKLLNTYYMSVTIVYLF